VNEMGGAGEAAAALADEIAFAFAGPVPTQCAAKAVVPLRPSRRKRTDPIAVGTKVPRLGNQFGARQDRVLPDGRKEGHASIKPIGAAAERTGEIEPEPGHAAKLHPVSQ